MMTKIDMLKMLKAKVSTCQKCPELAASRTQTVFDNIIYDDKDSQLVKSGNPNAQICFVAEAPGRNEDIEGEVLVGKAGRLLSNIVKACGWDRKQDTYLCNIIKCRPPQNRTPNETECANCLPFFKLQIRIIDPKYIICLGNIAAQNLLGTTDTITNLRGRLYDYEDGPVKAKVLPTYHPSYLLRNELAKEDVWEDLELLLSYIKGNHNG